jgi:hypothetical protein
VGSNLVIMVDSGVGGGAAARHDKKGIRNPDFPIR